MVAGDFNHINLTDTLPKFYQQGNNTLDRVYTNKNDVYRAVPHPHLFFSDHISFMLVTASIVLSSDTTYQHRHHAIPALQDCSQCTDWQIFRDAPVHEEEVDLKDYTSPVLNYINKYTEDVTKTRAVTDYPNQKPWLNMEVRSLLKAR